MSPIEIHHFMRASNEIKLYLEDESNQLTLEDKQCLTFVI